MPGEGELDLMALDFGHLTPKASMYLGRVMWQPYLDRMLTVIVARSAAEILVIADGKLLYVQSDLNA